MSRKLDAAIAEALGYKLIEPGAEMFGILMPEDDCFARVVEVVANKWGIGATVKTRYKRIPEYSTDGNAMLVLIAEARRLLWYLSINSQGTHFKAIIGKCEVNEHDMVITHTAISPIVESLPYAVALAAYKALTGEGWTE